MKDDLYPSVEDGYRWLANRCSRCAERWQMRIDWDRWETYRNGGSYVQDVFPDLDADEREFLLGLKHRNYLCPTCWDEVFPDEWKQDSADSFQDSLRETTVIHEDNYQGRNP